MLRKQDEPLTAVIETLDLRASPQHISKRSYEACRGHSANRCCSVNSGAFCQHVEEVCFAALAASNPLKPNEAHLMLQDTEPASFAPNSCTPQTCPALHLLLGLIPKSWPRWLATQVPLDIQHDSGIAGWFVPGVPGAQAFCRPCLMLELLESL